MLNIVFFSPTGTTKALALAVAKGIGGEARETDCTLPEAREMPVLSREDILVLAVPVYMGRVPDSARRRMEGLRADGTPTVCLVVYGNRAYEDALVELRDIAVAAGCAVVAGAACLGEHSFSSPDAPTAEGRPDTDDLARAEAFGRTVREKLRNAPAGASGTGVPDFPGVVPYRKSSTVWDVDFISVDPGCTGCMTCADVCPTGAVDRSDPKRIDIAACLTCCACVKACPSSARAVKESPVMDRRRELHTFCSERKEPEFFI